MYRQWSKLQLPTTAGGEVTMALIWRCSPSPSPLADSLIPYCSNLRRPKRRPKGDLKEVEMEKS